MLRRRSGCSGRALRPVHPTETGPPAPSGCPCLEKEEEGAAASVDVVKAHLHTELSEPATLK